jgi:hypothetical protein
MEVSRTQVLDRPLAGRRFFEEVIRDNLDLGRPDRVQLLFPRKITRRTPGRFRTRVFRSLLTVMEGSVHGLPPPLERALAAVDDELDKLLEGAIAMKKVA